MPYVERQRCYKICYEVFISRIKLTEKPRTYREQHWQEAEIAKSFRCYLFYVASAVKY